MKTLIVYDSLYGNTETIAGSIAKGITGDVKVVKVTNAKAVDVKDIDLLIIGSPTQGGRYTKTMDPFLGEISGHINKTTKIAIFDTRVSAKWVKVFGYAAGKLADFIKKEGFEPVVAPEPFMVESAKGPIKEGELERATQWGKNIGNIIKG
jgi:flavodoxin I